MKAYLCFDLEDTYEREKHETMLAAEDLKFAIQDFSEWLIALNKHTARKSVEIELVREKFFECLKERDLELW